MGQVCLCCVLEEPWFPEVENRAEELGGHRQEAWFYLSSLMCVLGEVPSPLLALVSLPTEKVVGLS